MNKLQYTKFNSAVNKFIYVKPSIKKSINLDFEKVKNILKNEGIKLRKLNDFAYNTYYSKQNIFNLDLCVEFFDKKKINLDNLFKKTKEILDNSSYNVKENGGYIHLKTKLNNYECNFRIIAIREKSQNYLGVNYVTSRSNFEQKDLSLNVTIDFIKANKLSSGILFSIKKILNYILNNSFPFTYNIDMMLLTWFNEMVSFKIEKLIEKKELENEEYDIDKENLLKPKNLAFYIRKNFTHNEIITYLINKLYNTNSHYFGSYNFSEDEFFDQVSRYSLNTNSNFRIPLEYNSRIEIFNIKNFEQLTIVQKYLSNENGFSKIAYDNVRAQGNKFFVTPVICSGTANYSLYKKWVQSTSNLMFDELDKNLKVEIKTIKQREGLTALNFIAHRWLTIYYSKLKYIQPFFDKKYPLYTYNDPIDLISILISSIDRITEDEWFFGNEN